MQVMGALPFKKSTHEVSARQPSLVSAGERDEAGETQYGETPFRPAKVLPFDETKDPSTTIDAAPHSASQPLARQAEVAAPAPPPSHGPSRSDTSRIQLTLEQYAAFCAERTIYPDRVAAVMARYQLRDHAQVQLLDQTWRARVADDHALSERYSTAFEHYCKWLREQGR